MVGIREKDFWKLTWNEYQHRVNKYENDLWSKWDRTRRIACEIYNMDNQKPIHYEKYIGLPTDNSHERRAATKAANLAFLAEMEAKGRLK